MAQHPRLSTHQQPALPLIEMRKNRLELRHQSLLNLHRHAHNRSTGYNPASYGLFLCAP
jgi:hypothetical protein